MIVVGCPWATRTAPEQV